ncbi:hypothetical protein LO772_06700 [Yinghuangia sp. ASG 101]|uniref:hypothetical protein n=1 Tax=Yinghuangia sp. ASG 101 TaxID=2896848 RepID=UPI001E4F6121|nr:hypothetical protein [Yinghuangia sp. ASG 101]UGQ13298.1 hypothetical protein LO772_06700 [Yinghuangia sp. ASG 101]
MYRQGDILLLPVDEHAVPTGVTGLPAKPRDSRGRIVLALGEVTGHAHAVVGSGTLFLDPEPTVIGHLKLDAPTRLVHEEHAAISLPKGWYRVIRQREYVPGAVRIVAD